MKLAARFGWVDVDDMLDSIGERQFNEWRAFERLQPLGDERQDLLLGIGFAAVCNAIGAKVKPHQLMPFTEFDEQAENSKAEIERIRQFAIRQGQARPE